MDLYPASDPKAPCFVHIHGGYWQRGSKEIFACLSEGPLARGWSAALCGCTLAPEVTWVTSGVMTAHRVAAAKPHARSTHQPMIFSGVRPLLLLMDLVYAIVAFFAARIGERRLHCAQVCTSSAPNTKLRPGAASSNVRV